MSDIQWVGRHIEVPPCKRPKKITATRLATILGMNHWSTPFEIWCAVSRVYEKPFEDTIYTKAGKAIEPIQIQYMRDSYAMSNLRTPTDLYGADYFKKTWGDFFPSVTAFGGAWDSLLVNEDGTPATVLEFKTSKRAEDWGEDVPEYYAIQASLYAYLLGVDDVIMIASFLEPSDYEHPEQFTPSVANTITRPFKVSERYPNFAMMMAEATAWWNDHVVTGISPDYDEKKDAEILAALRTNSVSPDTDIAALVTEAGKLATEITTVEDTLKEKSKRLDTVKKMLKEYMTGQFRDGDNKVSVSGSGWTVELSRTVGTEVDKDRMVADGVWEKYFTKPKISDRLTLKKQ